MKRSCQIAAITALAALACLATAYWFALRYWTQRTAVIPIQIPEREVMWTGTISTTNGWEVTLRNLFDFRRRSVAPMVFCKKTRQLFVGFTDKQDDSFYQWDLDTGRCVYTFPAGEGFRYSPKAVSPDGKYLVVTRYASQVTDWKTLLVSVEKRGVVADLGFLGAILEVRFNPDCTMVWMRTGSANDPVVFQMDGTPVRSFPAEDFPKIHDRRIWNVPVSKFRDVNPGLFFKDESGIEHLLTTNYWSDNYWITKDGRIIVASSWNDEIIIWDADSAKEVVRQRITNHHNGGGYVIYDEAKDRFLIADPSYQGTTYLRVLLVTKRPPKNPNL